jgi:DNA topoisomerase-1
MNEQSKRWRHSSDREPGYSRRRKLDRETVLAAVVRLLDTEYVRVGNEEYARSNKSFGATTLRGRHLKSASGKLKIRFPGKHGLIKEVTVTDRGLQRVVRKCQELPANCCSNISTAAASPSR